MTRYKTTSLFLLVFLTLFLILPSQSFALSEAEPNNSYTTANPFLVNADYVGKINQFDDEDWYKITLTQEGALTLKFNHSIVSGSSYVYWGVGLLVEKNPGELSYFLLDFVPLNKPDFQLTTMGLPAGVYYVKINGFSNTQFDTSNYTLRANFIATPYWEKEPNDTLDQADPISFYQSYKGNLRELSDLDWYRFTLGSAGTIAYRFNHLIPSGSPANYYTLALKTLDAYGSEITLATEYVKGNSPDNTFYSPHLSSGTYYLEVQPYHYNDFSVSDYSIEVKDAISGWAKINGKWYSFKNGFKQKGWIKSEGKWYYLDNEGVMQTGWVKVSGKWYFLDSGGAMKTGWVKSNGKWYYLDASGAMRTGWVHVDGKWYYMDSSGAMQTGWIKSSGKWYYLDASGAMVTGWKKISDKWYYFYEDGSMAHSTTINGYILGADGAWIG